MDTVQVTLLNGTYVTVQGVTEEGVVMTVGGETPVPLGSEITVTATGPPLRFRTWSALGAIINGSASVSETYVVTGAHTVRPLERGDASVWLDYGPSSGGVQLFATVLQGTPVPITAPGGFKVDGSVSAGGGDGNNWRQDAEVLSNSNDDDPIALRPSPLSLPGDTLIATVVEGPGAWGSLSSGQGAE